VEFIPRLSILISLSDFLYNHHYINAILLHNVPDYTRLPDGQEYGTADELEYAMIRIINPAG